MHYQLQQQMQRFMSPAAIEIMLSIPGADALMNEIGATYDQHQAGQIGLSLLVSDHSQMLADASRRISEAEKLAGLGMMTACVSHEVNNPLSFLKSNLQTLKRYSALLSEDRREAVSAIESADLSRYSGIDPALMECIEQDLPVLLADCVEGVDRVGRIVRELREQAMDSRDVSACTAKDIFDSALKYSRQWLADGLEVKQDIRDRMVVCTDQHAVVRVLVNLVRNASQALDGAGRIVLSAEGTDELLKLTVSDNGPGLSDQQLLNLFQPFVHGASPERSPFAQQGQSRLARGGKGIDGGMGLGLFISRNVAERLGGSLTAMCGPEGGVSFTLALPRTPQDAATSKTEPTVAVEGL